MDERSRIEPPSVRDHLANERTLLAWVRTALTVVGLGFIVNRLALAAAPERLEAMAGIGLVLLGGLIALGGAWSFMRARREMVTGSYQPAIGLHVTLVAAVVVGALVVAIFLVANRPPG
jgi:putative membrane protein